MAICYWLSQKVLREHVALLVALAVMDTCGVGAVGVPQPQPLPKQPANRTQKRGAAYMSAIQRFACIVWSHLYQQLFFSFIFVLFFNERAS